MIQAAILILAVVNGPSAAGAAVNPDTHSVKLANGEKTVGDQSVQRQNEPKQGCFE